MLSIKKIDTILKDKDFIKHIEKIYHLKITNDFVIKRETKSIYTNGTFKAVSKKHIISAQTNKNFSLIISKREIETEYKNYKK